MAVHAAGLEERVVKQPLGGDLQWFRTFARRYPLPTVCGIAAVLITLLGVFATVVSPDDPSSAQCPGKGPGTKLAALAGHGFHRQGRAQPHTPRDEMVPVRRRHVRAAGHHVGSRVGGCQRLSRRPVRLASRACGRSAVVLSAGTPGAVARLGPWSEHGNGHPVHRRHQGGLRRPDHPVPGVGREGDSVRRSCQEPGIPVLENHLSSHRAPVHRDVPGSRHDVPRHRHRARGHAGLPRRRHSASHADVGQHAGRRGVHADPQWHLVVFPGAAIVITVLAFNQFGDGLRDALDPRLRGTNL